MIQTFIAKFYILSEPHGWNDFSVSQFSSVTPLCLTLCDPTDYRRHASLFITNSRSLLKLMSVELVMPSNHLILCRPLFLTPSILPASGSFPVSHFFPSGGQRIGVSASASVLPMNYSQAFVFETLTWDVKPLMTRASGADAFMGLWWSQMSSTWTNVGACPCITNMCFQVEESGGVEYITMHFVTPHPNLLF